MCVYIWIYNYINITNNSNKNALENIQKVSHYMCDIYL